MHCDTVEMASALLPTASFDFGDLVSPPPLHLTGAERRAALDALAISLGAVNKPIHLSDSETIIEGPVKHISRLESIAPVDTVCTVKVDSNGRIRCKYVKRPDRQAALGLTDLHSYIVTQMRLGTYWQYSFQNVALMLPEQVVRSGNGVTADDLRRAERDVNVIVAPGALEQSESAETDAFQMARAVGSTGSDFPPPNKARVFKLYYQWPPDPLPTLIDESSLLNSGVLSVPLSAAYAPVDLAVCHLGAMPPRGLIVTIEGEEYVPMTRSLTFTRFLAAGFVIKVFGRKFGQTERYATNEPSKCSEELR